jgi:uncharacterized membrane protein
MEAGHESGHRLRRSERWLQRRIEEGDPFWPPQLAVGLAIVFNLALSEKVTIGPNWLLPGVETILLLVLILTTRGERATRHAPARRRFALVVIALVSVANIVSVCLLIHYLLKGGHAAGRPLIGSGALLFATNVLLFSVWYWELDGGGPVERFRGTAKLRDFQFPQMENPTLAPPNWRPSFGDYLYTSLTNATAFSPTDTMPLTVVAKAVMALQSLTALATVALVVARAVNILA